MNILHALAINLANIEGRQMPELPPHPQFCRCRGCKPPLDPTERHAYREAMGEHWGGVIMLFVGFALIAFGAVSL